MGYFDILVLYNLVLWAVIGTYMAAGVVRKLSIFFLNKDPLETAEKLKKNLQQVAAKRQAKAEKVAVKRQAKRDKLSAKIQAVEEGLRNCVADGLHIAEQEVRPDQ